MSDPDLSSPAVVALDQKMMARLKPGCICRGIRLQQLIEALDAGADSFEAVARLTGIGDGSCHGRRCRKKVEDLLAERKN
ncbi:(2Fe-2S)-binding protein [Desulfolithobacter sp.]